MSIKPKIDQIQFTPHHSSSVRYSIKGLKLDPRLRAGDSTLNCSCHGWIIRLCVLRVWYNVLAIPPNMTSRGVQKCRIVE